ncbi:MAG: bifunctional pyr operon transcriptional regulator/uracil phosphoribosyltransferase [Deltaproteobacteria bacterium RIFOXYD12_FULL_50_9]|nr:MAG: bifunctional pyr operon transcriptional regulator/uracil phosphoribosyltransferase [Deltaproteobacteria bacterium RIFOXYD12_FULL_50_9]
MVAKKKRIMSAEDIERSLNRMALQIMEKNKGNKNLAIVGIYTGGIYLADRLKRIIKARENIDLQVGSLDITLYRDDWSLASQNPVVKKTDINFKVDGYTLVLVDDVVFTGRTIRAALDAIMDFGRPCFIQLAVLIDRGGRELPIQPDFVGMSLNVNANEHINVLLEEYSGSSEVVLESFS